MARKNAKIAQRARQAAEKWYSSFNQNIDLYHLMHSFVMGSQWEKDEEDEMVKTYRKVPLTSNKLGVMANSLLGEQQQNTPQIQVVPMSNCTEEVASLREVIVKDIMFSQNSSIATQVAASQAAIGGFGALFVSTEYIHDKSFDLDIIYKFFKDATRCYWDISAEKISKTDGLHCGFNTRMSREKFREIYGEEIEEDILGTSSITQTEEEIALAVEPNSNDSPFSWADDEGITILNHFEREFEKDTLYKLSNGVILNQDEMDDLIDKSIEFNERLEQERAQQLVSEMLNPELITPEISGAAPQEPEMAQNIMQAQSPQGIGIPGGHDILPNDGMMQGVPFEESISVDVDEDSDIMTLWYDGEPVRIEDKRPHKKHKIIHYQISGEYVLDESIFPSEQLPVIFVDNNSYYDKSGKQITRSFFGDCRDTQRYINYLRTQSAYILKVSRYDQWLGSKKNVSSLDTQNNWKNPSNTQGMITYDESPSGAKPEQIRPPELSNSLFQQYQLAIEDLYTSTGLYPARLGDMGNSGGEASGKALDRWQRQGSYATYIFQNSINRAIASSGEIVNEMIPNVYDSERVLTLMMPDEGIKNVTINKAMDAYGEKIENDIRKGTYQVRLKPGPSYEGQKEQALQSLQQILQVEPSLFQMLADLYAENLPLPNTIEIRNRLKSIVPPEIIEAGKTGKPVPPKAPDKPSPEEQLIQVEMENVKQKAQAKQQELEIKMQELELEKQKMMLDAEFELKRLQTDELEAAGRLQQQELRYAAEIGRTQSQEQIANADNLVKMLTTRRKD